MADRSLTMAEWEALVGTGGHRVEPWQGRFMSSAARLTLINSSLSSLAIYADFSYLLMAPMRASTST
jgi:hypothetical protein